MYGIILVAIKRFSFLLEGVRTETKSDDELMRGLNDPNRKINSDNDMDKASACLQHHKNKHT